MSAPEEQECRAASGDLRLITTLRGVRDERELGSADEYRADLAEPVASHRSSSRPAAGTEWRTVVRSAAL
jgi:hypothetical protein